MKMNVKMAQNIFVVFGIVVSITLAFAIYNRLENPVQSEEKVSIAQAETNVAVKEEPKQVLYVQDIGDDVTGLILTDDQLAASIKAEKQADTDTENKDTNGDVFVKPEKPTEIPVTTPPDYKPDTVPPADLLDEYDGQYVSAKDVVDVPEVDPVTDTKVDEKPVVTTTPTTPTTDTTKPDEKPVTTTTDTNTSNLVPDSENPFKNTAPTTVEEYRITQEEIDEFGEPGQGDKF